MVEMGVMLECSKQPTDTIKISNKIDKPQK